MIQPLLLALLVAQPAPVQPAPAQPPPIRLSLEPRAEPVPALKYLLLPELRDRKSGNAALLYYRAFSPDWQGHRQDAKFQQKVFDLAAKPLRDLQASDLAPLEGTLRSLMLREVDRGARRAYCDWELLDRAREEGMGLLLPDVQSFREFAPLLQLRARQELLAGEYVKAAGTLQTGLAMSRHVMEGPTLIHGLVAAACASTMVQAVEDWIERPGSPNLYWALTDLPRPLISLRSGMEAERLLSIDSLFPGYRAMLDDPKAPPGTSPVLATSQAYIHSLQVDDSLWGGSVLYALRTYPTAKRFLRERGRSAEEVEKMPAMQVVFLYEIHHFDVAYDDLRKWANLPYHEAAPHMSRAVARTKSDGLRNKRAILASLLLPALHRVMAVSTRIDRKIAALRCVEALRLHAAANGGKWPTTLEEVTAAPIPLDPWTGKAFAYRRDGDKATLSGAVAANESASYAIRYELTLRPAKEKD